MFSLLFSHQNSKKSMKKQEIRFKKHKKLRNFGFGNRAKQLRKAATLFQSLLIGFKKQSPLVTATLL
jgi:hypothetical protein